MYIDLGEFGVLGGKAMGHRYHLQSWTHSFADWGVEDWSTLTTVSGRKDPWQCARKHKSCAATFPWTAKKIYAPHFQNKKLQSSSAGCWFFQQNQTRSTPWIVFQQVLKKPIGLLPPNILISTCSPKKLPVRFRYHIKKQLVEIIFSYFTYKFTLQQNWQRKETGRSAFFSASFF